MSASDDSTSRQRASGHPNAHFAAPNSVLPASSFDSSIGPEDQVGGTAKQADLMIGWREWVSLPLLGLPAIKAKIDTGARTSAIHAFDIEQVTRNGGEDWLAFTVQPVQRDASIVRRCFAPLVDIRSVTDSGGHTQDRYFISTQVQIGPMLRAIELTLAQREDMLFRMLLGRTAMLPNIHVDPALSFTLGRMSARSLYAEDAAGVST